MYSLVLMTAMTTSPSAPEFNGYFRDLFFGNNCYGSNMSPRYSCYGGGCAGSGYPAGSCNGSGYPAGCTGANYNSGCNGCNGCHGDTFVNRVRRWFNTGNCCGGSGSGYGFGCTGSGYSCSGSAGYSCSGSAGYSCFGSSAAYSCFGSPPVSYAPMYSGGQSCYGGSMIPFAPAPTPTFESYPVTPAPGMPAPNGPPSTIPYAPPEAAPGTNSNTGLKPAGYSGSALVSNGNNDPATRATVIVKLPVDARLFADARQLSITGAERKFVSPQLPAGQEFTYRFRVEYERDGEMVSVTKKLPVRAGGSYTIEFTDLTAKATPAKNPAGTGSNTAVAVTPAANHSKSDQTPVKSAAEKPSDRVAASSSTATDRAMLTVKMPPGATLYVNDRRSPSIEAVRQFSTPPLPIGRDFSYLMKAEIVRNGRTETFSQKVPFRAGERVEVDFTAIGR